MYAIMRRFKISLSHYISSRDSKMEILALACLTLRSLKPVD